MSKPRTQIFTDGSCLENPGPGGWAFVIVGDSEPTSRWGSEDHSTNNRMEMTAALEAMRHLSDGARVTLHTDSRLLCRGMNEWIEGWKRNHWARPRNATLENSDLWQLLDSENQRLDVEWRWVKAHDGNHYNEMADRLANRAAREQTSGGS